MSTPAPAGHLERLGDLVWVDGLLHGWTECLARGGIDETFLTGYAAMHDGPDPVVDIANAVDRLRHWAIRVGGSPSRATRATGAGLLMADLPVLTGWLAATAPHLSNSDPLGHLDGRVTPYRGLPYGWVYSAAGITATEARRTTPEQAQVLAVLRGVTVPALTPASGAPLVARARLLAA